MKIGYPLAPFRQIGMTEDMCIDTGRLYLLFRLTRYSFIPSHLLVDCLYTMHVHYFY